MRPGLAAPLFVPGDRPDRFAKAAASGTDAVIIDLEDAVADDRKAQARAALNEAGSLSVPVVVRVNGADTPWFADDLKSVSDQTDFGVMLPKSEDPAIARDIAERLPSRRLVLLIETGRGLARAFELAQVPGIDQLAFGQADYCADLGCDPTDDALIYARSILVHASRLAGLSPPLDGPSFAINDAATAGVSARYARSLGFGGKLCVHPRQVEAVLGALRPSAEDLAWARRAVSAAEQGGAVRVDGMMVDGPILARARRLLALAQS